MLPEDFEFGPLVIVAAIIGGSVLAGAISHWFLRHLAGKDPGAKGVKVLLLGGLRRIDMPIFILLGLYGATMAAPIASGTQQVVLALLRVAALLAFTFAGAGMAGNLVAQYAARNDRLPGATTIFANIVRVLVWTIGGLVVLQTVGVSVAPILGALGVGGLAVALALQDTLSNLFAGLHIITSKKLLPGDYVEFDSGEEGYVQDVNWRNTTIKTLGNNAIVLPNSRVATAILTNYYQPSTESSLIVQVGVSYSSDLEAVERVTVEVGREVLAEVSGGIEDFEPLIRYHNFGDSSIDFSVILRIAEPTAQYLIKHEFVKRLHARYQREGIDIPFPIRQVISGDQDPPRHLWAQEADPD